MTGRRPLPAFGLILVLAALTTVVWWRVLHRPEPAGKAAAVACPTSSETVLPAPSNVTVRVLNATDRTGFAAAVRHDLQTRGFQVGSIDNAPQAYRGVAVIDYASASKDAATLLGYYFPGAQLREQQGTDRTVTVSVGARFTGLPAAKAVSQALAKAHVTQSPAATAPPGGRVASSSAGC